MDILKGLIEATEAEPFAEVNGHKIYDFQGAVNVTNRKLAEEKIGMKDIDLGDREVKDGGLGFKRSRADAVAVNPELFTMNRYRKVTDADGKTTYEVVTDYRAITEQKTGLIYKNAIPVFVIGKQGKGLTVLGVKNITDTEFVDEFRGALDVDSMKDVLRAIERHGVKEPAKEKLVF